MISCISDVSAWMKSNCLVQLDTAKTEFMWCAPSRQQYLIPATPLLVDNNSVLPVTSVRDLEIYLNWDTSWKTHVSKTTCCCFNALRQIRNIQRSASKPVLLFAGHVKTKQHSSRVLVERLAVWLSETTTAIISTQADGFTNQTEDGR